jgi:hypothetical protein
MHVDNIFGVQERVQELKKKKLLEPLQNKAKSNIRHLSIFLDEYDGAASNHRPIIIPGQHLDHPDAETEEE